MKHILYRHLLFLYKEMFFILFFSTLPLTCMAQVDFSLMEDGNKKCLSVKGLDSVILQKILGKEINPDQYLQIYVGKDTVFDNPEKPFILGKYELVNNAIVFCPSFPFRPEVAYTAILKNNTHYTFTISFPESPSPILQAFYPTTDTIPANQLKFYLYFSLPMQEGRAYEKVLVKDEENVLLEDFFVRLEPELWDKSHQRLTLWTDPGRIKRGLLSNEEKGYPLEENHTYTISVSREWKDMEGRPMSESFQKKIYVAKADRQKPEINQWTYKIPASASIEPLEIYFGESMDQVLALQCITILNQSGEQVTGTVRLDKTESRWIFTPDQPWESGAYKLRVDAKLEDLAGNNLNRLFDRDVESDKNEVSNQEFYWKKFRIGF